MKRFIPILIFYLIFTSFNGNHYKIDSNMSFSEAITGTEAPKQVLDSIVLIDVYYTNFDGSRRKGQLLVNKSVKQDIIELFGIIDETKFPVDKVVPIVAYAWSDDASMEDNNSSAFNYRFIAGTKRLSNHSFGRAVDINPLLNPVVYKDGKTSPGSGEYKKGNPGVFDINHKLVKEFKKRGWRWGGEFNSYKDYHHFDKAD